MSKTTERKPYKRPTLTELSIEGLVIHYSAERAITDKSGRVIYMPNLAKKFWWIKYAVMWVLAKLGKKPKKNAPVITKHGALIE